ncbi:hypothetical protein ACBP89_23910 [Aneurinibacillus aneurinilyticus]|uniref:hypothetical protein n=1 Tax=Aneurinibacillus aneurinilyticus TaxID=1391 RepID=UPI003525D04C
MRTNKYWKYFDRAIKEYKKRVVSDEEVKEILDDRMKEMKDLIQKNERNCLTDCLGILIGVDLEMNAKNRILNGEPLAWILLEQQLFWLNQMIKSNPSRRNVSDREIGGLIGLSLLWGYEEIAELTYKYATNMFMKDRDFYSENKTHHVFMTCLYYKWKTGEMPDLFNILPDDHVYQKLMRSWNDTNNFGEHLYELCDFHIYSLSDTPHKLSEILSFDCIPYDYYCIRLIREKEGLATPNIEHPLLQTPLAEIPKDKPGYKLDEDEVLQFVIQNEKVPDWQRIIR